MRVKKPVKILFSVSLLFLVACTTTIDNKEVVTTGQVRVLGTLSGDLPITALQFLPLEQHESPVGYLNNQKQLDAVLQTLVVDNNKLPAVNFSSQIVLFTRNTRFYNRIMIAQVNLEHETLTVVSRETRSAKPIVDKIAISLAVIERGAARFIDAGGQAVVIKD